jgi:hypothetical protein
VAVIKDGGGTTAKVETAAERNARLQAAFNAASNTPAVPSTTSPVVPSYNVQDIQGQQRSTFRATSLDVPYEQFKANVNAARPWDKIEEPLRYNVQNIQGTPSRPAPVDIGGDMTPGEATAAGWYGVSTAYWREDPNSMALRAAGQTPVYGADLAAQATANYINNFGWPSFITPYVTNALGLSDDEMGELGYVQDPGGHWVRTERSAPSYSGGGTIAGDASVPRYSYSSGSGRSIAGRAGGLINWRIGF